jgi:cell division protein FtsW
MSALLDKHPDKILIFSALALTMLGVIVIYSASGPYCQFLNPPKPTWHYMMRQSMWAVVALVGMFIASRLNYHVIVKYSPILLSMAVMALVAVLFLSRGDAKRWINVAGFTFQPSEFFKIALVAFMARMAAKNINQEFSLKKYATVLAAMAGGALLIIKEPDLGTTSLVMSVAVAMLFLAGFPKKYILLIGTTFIAAACILVFVFKYEIHRIDEYKITIQDPLAEGASYQTRQSLVSLGSGGLIGKGLGNGGQKHLFLPARHTDFILSSAAEEGGFMVVMAILILFGLIGLAGYRIAKSAMDVEGSFFAWGILLFIIFQALINIAVDMGIFPITGMTLPFLSYGGSSLLICMVGIGLIASVAKQTRSPRHYFQRVRG